MNRKHLAVFVSALVSISTGAIVVAGNAGAVGRVTMAGSSPSWASAPARVASVASSASVPFYVSLRMRNTAAATARARAVSDPENSAYGDYLTTAQVRSLVSPTSASVKSVSAWLRSQGFKVGAISANRTSIAVSGTAAQVDKAFAVQLATYRVGRAQLRATDRALTIPAAVASSILAIEGLNQVPTKTAQQVSTPAVVPPSDGFRIAPPCSAYYGQKIDKTDPRYQGRQLPYAICGYTPKQFRSAYGIASAVASGADGRGVTVAVIDAYGSPTVYADAAEFAARNDPAHPLTTTQFSEQVATPTPGTEDPSVCDAEGWYGEETLDVEAVHGMAPGAKILYRGAADCFDALYGELNDVVAGHLANIVTDSWGDEGEQEDAGSVESNDQIFIQAALEGIGIYFSSGDDGDEVANIGVRATDYPASDPWITAVGGTSLEIGATGTRVLETGWEDDYTELDNGVWTDYGFSSGSGGGTSQLFPEPAYQRGVVPKALAAQGQAAGTLGRVVPDIAMDGEPASGMLVGQTQTFPDGVYYDQYRIGGTSVSSPLLAGLVADSDSLVHMHHGFLNPMLYSPIVRRTLAVTDIRPIVGGVVRNDYNDDVDTADGTTTSLRWWNATDLTLHTTNGYDNVTGLGVPNGLAFLLLR